MNEGAQDLIEHVLDSYRAHRPASEAEAEIRQQIKLAERECLSKGITTFEDAGSPFATVDLFRKMAEQGELGLRMWVMLRAPQDELAANLRRYYMVGVGGDHLTVRAIKEYMDGALGLARGVAAGAVLGPAGGCAESQRDQRGASAVHPQDGRAGHRQRLSTLHARHRRPGQSRGAEFVRSGFSRASGQDRTCAGGSSTRSIWTRPISRASAQLGVIAAMQGIHCTSDGPFVIARLGRERAEAGAYVWQKLMKSGAVVANGTDTPVEDVDPIQCYYASVSRRLKDGNGVLSGPEDEPDGSAAVLHHQQCVRGV